MEIGIGMGCAIFTILFVKAMEIILKAEEGSAGPAHLDSGCMLHTPLPLKAFVDDTTVICSIEAETRRMLERLESVIVMVQDEFQIKEVSQPLSKKRKHRNARRHS